MNNLRDLVFQIMNSLEKIPFPVSYLKATTAAAAVTVADPKSFNLALQLYTIRDAMEKDDHAVLGVKYCMQPWVVEEARKTIASYQKMVADWNKLDMAPVGAGIIDFKPILAAKDVAGMKHLVVEQDCSFTDIKTSIANLASKILI